MRIVPATYLRQISSVSCSSAGPVDDEEQQIEEGLQSLLREFPDVLVDPGDLGDGMVLGTMVGPPMETHLRPDAKPFASHTPNAIPLA